MRCEMCNRGEVNTKFRSRAEETITVLGSQRMAYSLPFSRRFRVNEINGSVYVGARIHCVADCILPMALIDKRNFFPNFTLFLSLVRTDHLFWNSPWICSVGMKRWQSCIAHSLIRSLAHTYAPPNKQQTLLHHNWIHRVGAQIKVIKAISLCVCVCVWAVVVTASGRCHCYFIVVSLLPAPSYNHLFWMSDILLNAKEPEEKTETK